jgi:hypothetical protein
LGRFRGIQQKNSIIYYPELTATVKIAYIKKSTGFRGIPPDSYIPAGFRLEYVGECKGLRKEKMPHNLLYLSKASGLLDYHWY